VGESVEGGERAAGRSLSRTRYLMSIFVTGTDVWTVGGHNQVLRRALS
jgi:hypothetical protein